VVFVDRVSGFGQCGSGKRDTSSELVILDVAEIADVAKTRYDHAAGLAYLLRVLPAVCETPAPPTVLVGIEGNPDERVIDKAARLALEMAVKGSHQNDPVGLNPPEVKRENKRS